MATEEYRRGWDGIPLSWWGKAAVMGLAAGVVMAIFEVCVSGVKGDGFWMPMNIIGATIPHFLPVHPQFEWDHTLVGIGLHLVVSTLFGLVYGFVAARAVPAEARQLPFAALLGMFFGTVVWIIIGMGLAPWIDPTVRMADPLVYALGHLVYGVTVAVGLALWARDRELHYLAVTFAPQEMEEATHARTERRH